MQGHLSFALLTILLLLQALLPESAAAEGLALSNGDFKEWAKGLPVGWARSEGAKNGASETRTVIAEMQGGGVSLAGSAGTHHWSMLTQAIDVRAGEYLELTFAARGIGLKKEPGQFGSCYVGFLLRDDVGKPNGFIIEDVSRPEWRTEHIRMRVPASARSVHIAIFLSQTGRLEVRDVGVRPLEPEDSFQTLVSSMDRHYSFFAAHEIDWKALTEKYARPARAAKTPAAFINAVRPMLAALEDGHVWIDAGDGVRSPTWTPQVTLNFNLQQMLSSLTDVKQVIRNVLSARTKDGYGYLALGTMEGSEAQYAAVEQAWRGLFDAPGIVLDLRIDSGGQERWGQRLLGFLTKKKVLYGRAQRRAGPAYDDLEWAGDRHLLPSHARGYEGPVVVLIGPGCVSSGEGMAMMLKALPRATLVGLPTRGSSGNPHPVHLPNGVTVWYSRWISQFPDGSPLERRGVMPDLRVEAVQGANPSFEEALKMLRAKTAAR